MSRIRCWRGWWVAKRSSMVIPNLQSDAYRVEPIDISEFDSAIKDVQQQNSPFRENPPSPHEFIHSPHYINRPNLYPAIQEDMEVIFSGPDYTPICEIFLDDEGFGSGKSTKMAVIAAYLIVWVLHLRDIEDYFNLEPGLSRLAIYNMAPHANVARDIVFSRFQSLLVGMPWFKDNGIQIDEHITSQIVFKGKPLVIRPGNSSKAFGTGYDTFGGMIDECAADGGFETKEKDNFQDLFDGMNERRRSRFIDTPHRGLIVCASTAGTENRAFERMMSQVEEFYQEHPEYDPKTDPIDLGDDDIGKVLVRRRSAFEANPKHKVFIDNGEFFEDTIVREPRPGKKITYNVQITNKFKRNYQTNPHKVLRNMCAIPSLAIDTFFTEWDKVLQCVKSSGRIDPYPNEIDEYGYLKLVSPPEVYRELPDNFHGLNKIIYYMHVDLALSGDGCGLAIGHRGPNVQRGDLILPTVVMDLSICFQGDLEHKIRIAEVKQFIIDLAVNRGFHFGKITFDNFQSAGTIQELEDAGYPAEKNSVKKDAFNVLMELLYDNRLDWYQDEWALGEAKRLEDKGKVVEKSMGSTDDEIECVAKVCEIAVEGEVLDNIQQERAAGFSSKGKIPRTSAGGTRTKETFQNQNPQLAKRAVPSATGFSRPTRRRRVMKMGH